LEPLILRLLGLPEVSCGRQFLRFRSRKELALVFYLATEGGLHPREKLAALLWPEAGETRAGRLCVTRSTGSGRRSRAAPVRSTCARSTTRRR
jgi:hypothetical protein